MLNKQVLYLCIHTYIHTFINGIGINYVNGKYTIFSRTDNVWTFVNNQTPRIHIERIFTDVKQNKAIWSIRFFLLLFFMLSVYKFCKFMCRDTKMHHDLYMISCNPHDEYPPQTNWQYVKQNSVLPVPTFQYSFLSISFVPSPQIDVVS